MYEVTKSDWKLFRERVPEWQECYMDRLTKEYIELLGSSKKASDRFWELEKRIRTDKKNPGVILEMRRSEMLWNLARMVAQEVITLDDLDGFSEDLVEAVKYMCSR